MSYEENKRVIKKKIKNKLDFFIEIVYNFLVMNNTQNNMTVLANCEREAKEAISNYARTLCESLTDSDIDTIFGQMLYLEETIDGGDYRSLIKNAQESGFRIDKYSEVEDIDALIDDYIDKGIDEACITTHEVEGGIIVTYEIGE